MNNRPLTAEEHQAVSDIRKGVGDRALARFLKGETIQELAGEIERAPVEVETQLRRAVCRLLRIGQREQLNLAPWEAVS